jgi:3-deoxy-manno-octulosonate cytidylyltransferase (CMP-KDO synthetase)
LKPVIIIPARYRSSRFEGKPLVHLNGRPMIARVWDRCVDALSADRVYVATDDVRIAEVCRAEGIQVLITGEDCLTGTDRVHEAARQVEADIYINVQGDEPLIHPDDIRTVIAAAQARPCRVVNAMCAISDEADFRSTTVPKVVTRPDNRLLYMSRAPIPTDKAHAFVRAMKQVCIYAFPRTALDAFAALGRKTPLEEIEDIEILRFLELDFDVDMVEVSGASIAVDVPEDVQRVERALAAAD